MSNIESGMNVYVGNLDKLANVCDGFGAAYNPVPYNLTVPSLRALSQTVKTAITAVDTALPVYVTAENARQTKFALLPPLATRVQAAATVLDLPDAIIVHVKEVVRKIRGKRLHKLQPEKEGDEPAKHISVSQTSFVEQIEHLNQLIALVESQPAYTPSEYDLTVPALRTLLEEMKSTNAAAVAAEVPLTNARRERDRLLYEPKTGMMDTALAVKNYVKAAFGASSNEYKEVNHIKFRNKKV